MTVKHNGSTVSVAGDNRITPLGAKLRHWKLDELPGLWDVLIGNMSFVDFGSLVPVFPMDAPKFFLTYMFNKAK
jgi:hypothetical protein